MLNGARSNCQFIPTNTLTKASPGVWVKPNFFGGSCGYLVLLGVS